MAKLPTEKNVPPMLFYGKNLAQFVFMFETQSYCELEVPIAGSHDFNWLSRELSGFVTRIYLMVTSEVLNEGVT